ncbi:hypothetical protein PV726_32565 [Streptomyces europaeiscabiei]|uniref:hypothetical protein n=1 Tax=Streptomyces europaeiscabiei TaxID=146819 RepID=UPI0029A0264C|nr:hypothetical protein [Streptomyces europaeiscabiei]MDX3694992.1 hypothetical protein [Streptomyces europaeiscabiei]
MSSTNTPLAVPEDGYYMRIVNAGTPERVTGEDAVREVLNAHMQREDQQHKARGDAFDGVPVEIDAQGSQARIDYHDVRGVVELRPATPTEAIMDVKPESERYASGDRVIVRGVYYVPETRTHHVLPEYEGTVVNWHAGHYNVRAVEPDEHGAGGVRQCRVRELRPAKGDTTSPLVEGQIPVTGPGRTQLPTGSPSASGFSGEQVLAATMRAAIRDGHLGIVLWPDSFEVTGPYDAQVALVKVHFPSVADLARFLGVAESGITDAR